MADFPPITNYCISYLDLLGMKQALQDQALVPMDTNEPAFRTAVENSVAVIYWLQTMARDLFRHSQNAAAELRLVNDFPAEDRADWDGMWYTSLQMQPWSDGLIYFSNIGDSQQKCQINGIYEILITAGLLFLQALAAGRPLRGGIDIAWGTELEPGDLYGAAMARAYELESEVAQYPRIVVHDRVAQWLQAAIENPSTDVFAENDRSLAKICTSILERDIDGRWIVSVLTSAFREIFIGQTFPEMYQRARQFVIDQLTKFRSSHDMKLASRYSLLLTYFDEHPL